MWQHPCWKILGIEATDQIKDIKRAYAKHSKEIHPEDHPEEFIQLHDAYQQAIALAKHQDPQSTMMQSDTIEEETDIPNAFDFQTIFKQSEQLHEQQIEKLRDQVFCELCTLLRKKSATLDDWQRFKEQDAFYYIASNDDIFIEQLYTFIKNQKISMRSINVLLQLIDEVSLYNESSRYKPLQEKLYQRFVYWKQRQDEIPIIKAYFGGSILVVIGMLLSLLFHNETFHLISMIVFCFYIGYIQFFSKKRVGNRKLRNPLSPLSIILSMIIVFLTYYYLMRQNIIQ